MLILPGFIFLVSFKFCEAGKRGETKPISIECLIASYIVKLAYAVVSKFLGVSDNSLADTIALLIFSVLTGALLGYIKAKQSTKEFIEKHLKVSLYSNLWLEMPDSKAGNYVDVHLKDECICYRGWFDTHFEHEGETWIILGDYIQIDPHKKTEIKDAGCNIDSQKQYEEGRHPKIAINLRDTTRIEFLGSEQN